MGSSGWMFAEVKGDARLAQFVRTRLLRLKVLLWYRPVYRFLRIWVSRA